MKKMVLGLFFACFVLFINYGAETKSSAFSYKAGHNFELVRYKTGDVLNKETIVANRKNFFGVGLGLSIAGGVFFTTAMSSSIMLPMLTSGFYASTAHIAMISLASASWALFLFFLAPAAVAMWILFGLAVKYEQQKGVGAILSPDNEAFGIRIQLGKTG